MSEQPRVLGGRYEVGDLIGRGGMAEVHVGHDLRLGRTVAVKILRADLARDSSFLARFRREAQAAAGLNHPAIVAVYDSGEQEVSETGGAPVQVPYIVMEYVEGRTLRELLNDEKVLDPDEAARITAAVLAALEFSHERGIVHRDIKPANVMLTRGGAVKVMDFGIARALADTAATMTQTSAVLGTARYLSPEQAQGEPVDARSDLYSAGCLFYELLTGRTPFVGDPVSLVYQHLGEQPKPPSRLQEDLPPEMDAVALHALAKAPADRYQTAAAFRADLQAARAGGPVSEAARATLAAVLGAAGAGVAGAAAAAGGTHPAPTESLRRPDRPAGATRAAGAATGGTAAAAGHGDPLDGYEDTDEIPVREERHRGGWLLLALLALLALAGVAWVMFQVLGPGQGEDEPDMVAVPELVGVTQQVAESRLEERGLEADVARVADPEPEGTVVGQDPGPGQEVEVGSTVAMEVSSGPDSVTIPNVIGHRQQAARVVLEQADLTVAEEVEERHDPEFDGGRVVATEPEVGQTVDPRDTVVTLVVASGQVEVPEVEGMDAAEAIAELRANRLTHGEEIVYVETVDVEPNRVLEQSVPAGEVVDYDTEVQLTVSREPPATQTITEQAPAETVTEEAPPPEDPPEPTDEDPEPTDEDPEPTDDEDEETEGPGGGDGSDPTEEP